MKDLAINNSIGGIALFGVHLADALNPLPSQFWHAFALFALNTALTFLYRWLRTVRASRRREEENGEKLDALVARVTTLGEDVATLRREFDDSRRPPGRAKRSSR